MKTTNPRCTNQHKESPVRKNKKRILQTMLGMAGITSTLSLSAEVKNLGIEGTITSVTDISFVLDGSITNGTPFQGYYVFDLGAADSNSDATVGDYQFTNAAAGIVVKAGNYVFRTNPQHVDFLIELVNRPSDDHYVLHSYNNVCSQPVLVDHISWQLDDFSGTALTDVALPGNPPVLTNFTQAFGLTVQGGGCPMGYFIRGEVTSAAPNPAVIPESPAVAIREAVEIQWPSLLGYFYQLQASNDMTNWINVGQAVMGDGSTQSRTIPKGTNAYFRAEIVNYAR